MQLDGALHSNWAEPVAAVQNRSSQTRRIECSARSPSRRPLPCRSGTSALFVYQSEFAGTNKATSATWGVGNDFDDVVQALREKGVTFEHYDDLPDTSRDGDVHSFADSGMRAVWFKDPDGNILNVGNAPA